MKISMIMCLSKNNGLGRNGELLFHISDDLKRFKKLTDGKPIVMGRKTWDSLPIKPLKGRENIVISTDTDLTIEGATVCNSVYEVLESDRKEIFVIGGSSIYEQFAPHCQTLHITYVNENVEDADTFFNPDLSEFYEINRERVLDKDGNLSHYYFEFFRN
jgi:dihydrofolate reductase